MVRRFMSGYWSAWRKGYSELRKHKSINYMQYRSWSVNQEHGTQTTDIKGTCEMNTASLVVLCSESEFGGGWVAYDQIVPESQQPWKYNLFVSACTAACGMEIIDGTQKIYTRYERLNEKQNPYRKRTRPSFPSTHAQYTKWSWISLAPRNLKSP